MSHWHRASLSRLCVLLWLVVVIAGILRAADDGFEDATTSGLLAGLTAAALAATACIVIRAAAGHGALRPAYRALRVIAVALWLMEAAMLVMRNTGGPHPDEYLLGFIIVIGLAAATATVCLAILVTDGHDKARLIRALAEASEQSAPALQRHLCQASSASLPGGR